MNKKDYPRNWPQIVSRVARRSDGRCECEGFCGLHTGRRCMERNGRKAKWASGKIVLTTAHLTHNPMDTRMTYLKHMCNTCHLRYDRLYHRENAKATLIARKKEERKKCGDMFINV